MTFVESVKTCFKKYTEFNGRATRSEYWFFFLFSALVGFSLGVLDAAIFPNNTSGVLSLIFGIITFIPYIAVGCRRLHDINRSGWWIALPYGLSFFAAILTAISETLLFLGLIAAGGSFILLIVWLATEGQKIKNRFGAKP